MQEGGAIKSTGTGAARRPSIAIGKFPPWVEQIEENLGGRYAVQFVDLNNAGLDEFDAIVPLQLDHYGALRRRPDLQGRKFFCPSEAATSLCDDKLELARFLIENGFGQFIPRLRAPGAPYPYVWKKRRGWWGLHCHIIKEPKDEAAFDLGDPEWFAQEFATGRYEMATHILRADEKIHYISTFGYGMVRSDFVKGAGDKPVSTGFVRECPYADLFSRMLERIGYEGTACIDYKLAYGQPQVLEINPRFGNSLCWDMGAYLDAYIDALS